MWHVCCCNSKPNSFKIVDSIYNVYVGILSFSWFLIANEACCLFCDWVAFDFDWYDTIMSGRYHKCWFNTSYCHLLFTVLSVCEKSAIFLNVAIFLCPKHMMVKISFVHQCQKLPQCLVICHKWWNCVWIWSQLFWGEVLSLPMLSLAIHLLCLMLWWLVE